MQDVTGKVAVVTGGASGIGRGMCRAFAGAGMKVVVADLDPDRIAATVEELQGNGAEAVGAACDVSKLEEVEALAKTALDASGRCTSSATTPASASPRPRST